MDYAPRKAAAGRDARSDEEPAVGGAELGDTERPWEFEADDSADLLRPDQAEHPGEDGHAGTNDGWELHGSRNANDGVSIPWAASGTRLG